MQQKFLTVVALSSLAICRAAPHEKRSSNYISSCGSAWMARDDVSSNNGEISRTGYLTAVTKFCEQASGQTVAAGGYLSMATRVFLDGGGDPSTNGIPGYVYFEVHNKQSSASHIVDGKSISKIKIARRCSRRDQWTIAPPICRNYQTTIPSAGGASTPTPREAPGKSDQMPYPTMRWERAFHQLKMP